MILTLEYTINGKRMVDSIHSTSHQDAIKMIKIKHPNATNVQII